MDVFDDPDTYSNNDVSQVAEKQFQEHYLYPLGDGVKYVRLESMVRATCQGQMLISIGRNAHEGSPL